ncbi:MAG: SDR family NAD(P)-dependent oxidoreductase [Emcibacteraceae bacterium]|nr:SDR family NAD(P)-dependent oxidoreductase [Emcibacteraceae bacterium]MDG1994964.1 SDR family NAD(P)-dependent oxidoreductase [Emcibacteraceae bacterium]
MSVLGKHAVVTGGGSGIGLAITKALSKAGANVTIMGRNKQRLDKVAEEYKNINVVTVDITNEDSVKSAIQKTCDIAPIDILINNAGDAKSAPFHKTDYSSWQHMINLNLNGTFLMTSAVISDMRDRNFGRIINIASTAGLKGYAFMAPYTAAKHGVVGLTRSVALELSNTDVTINAICPGFTNTDLVNNGLKNIMAKANCTYEEALLKMLSTDNQPRLIEPEEIAEKVIWLCNNDKNGEAILMSGDDE